MDIMVELFDQLSLICINFDKSFTRSYYILLLAN